MALIYENGVYTNKRSGGAQEVITPITIANGIAASSSPTIVTGVAGKVIRPLAIIVGSQTSTATFGQVYSSSGAGRGVLFNVQNNTFPSATYEDITGLFETIVGENLVGTVGAAAGIYISIKYIQYTV